MDIHIAAKYMKLGYRIRRACWPANERIAWVDMDFIKLTKEELLAEDWEIITTGIVKEFPITYQE